MRRESDTLRPGDRAPEFTLSDANGEMHSLSEFLSGRADLEGREGRADLKGRPLLLVFDRGTW